MGLERPAGARRGRPLAGRRFGTGTGTGTVMGAGALSRGRVVVGRRIIRRG